MAFAHGRGCRVVIDQYDLSSIFRSMDFSASVDTAESTVFGLDDKTFEPGLRSAEASLDGFYDTVHTATVHDRLGQAAPFVATIGPAGLALGARARLVSVNATNVTNTAGIADLVLLNWALQSTDRIGFGYALNDIATPSAAGNGTGVDQGVGAVSNAKWAFHCHLIALTGSPTNVTIKVQHSTDNNTFADLASATSGALTAAGAVRVTGTATVNRYVRVVVSFTGGTAPTATFSAAFSRAA